MSESNIKRCSVCKKTKPTSMFYEKKKSQSGFSPRCKGCDIEKSRLYAKTESGVVTALIGQIISRSRLRGHKKPEYTKLGFKKWLYLNGYKEFYESWVESGYEKDLKPSVDRIDDLKGYEFENIKLTTWRENRFNGYKDRLNAKGSNGSQCKPVIQYSLDGNIVNRYKSQQIAMRQTGFLQSAISNCCCGLTKTSYGFIWKYDKQNLNKRGNHERNNNQKTRGLD